MGLQPHGLELLRRANAAEQQVREGIDEWSGSDGAAMGDLASGGPAACGPDCEAAPSLERRTPAVAVSL